MAKSFAKFRVSRKAHQLLERRFFCFGASEVVRQVRESREPVTITVNGNVQAVIQDPLSYQDMQDQLTMLRILAHGRKGKPGIFATSFMTFDRPIH